MSPNPDSMLKAADRLRKMAGRKIILHRGGSQWGVYAHNTTTIPPELLSMMLNAGQAESLGPTAFRMSEGVQL